MFLSIRTCTRIQNSEPHRSFLFNFVIAEIFAELVQYARTDSILNDCNRIASYSGSSLDKLVAYIRSEYDSDCIDDYDAFVETYSAIENTNDMCRY